MTLRSQSSESEVTLKQVSSYVWTLQMGQHWAQGCCSYEEREPGSLPFTELPTRLISKYRPINHAFLKSLQNKSGQETEPNICIAFNSQKPAIPLTRKKPYTTTGEKDMPIFGPGPRRQGPCPPWLRFPCPRQRTFPGPPLPDTGSEIRG